MPRLPTVKPRQVVRALERAGFEIDHQTGSHIVLRRASDNRRVVVPWHDTHQQAVHLLGAVGDAGQADDCPLPGVVGLYFGRPRERRCRGAEENRSLAPSNSGTGELSGFRLKHRPGHVAVFRFQPLNQGMVLLCHIYA